MSPGSRGVPLPAPSTVADSCLRMRARARGCPTFPLGWRGTLDAFLAASLRQQALPRYSLYVGFIGCYDNYIL